ncbi:transketolase [[Clostridium] aminophilum]|uniref:Transketolase n=1 Tax=[Clostridium] aminophilum TaxID=1526 RepID=A0A1I0IDK2_9FIRM|nr:transketolase [[Clostridium] aminophilum]SET94981.1 transketolase [[Clostridium] aminophilum]
MNHNYFTDEDVKRLEAQAVQTRSDIIRMIGKAGAGHPGGSLSASDMITALYFHVMNIDPKNPQWADRDRFVLSKGHSCPALYSALARRGFFDLAELEHLREYGAMLQGHPDMHDTPGIDISTGSLGNGLAVGVGMALSGRIHHQDYMTYVLLGDGELQEGLNWEAAMAASHHDLKNLIAIVDCNGVQINGWVNEIMTVEPIGDKWRAFGWNVVEVNGHNMKDILTALHTAKTMRHPTVILMRTVKGRGVSFMEDDSAWHGKAPDEAQMVEALAQISKGGVV